MQMGQAVWGMIYGVVYGENTYWIYAIDICDQVVLQSVVCKWAGQFVECASGTSAPLQRPGTPQHQVLEPIFSHTYTF